MEKITECKGKTRERKKAEGLCVAVSCMKKAGKGTRFCYMHKRRYQKENNPHRYFYDSTRQNARRRKVGWNWSFAEFKVFCAETRYLEKKGRNRDGYSIDRIDPRLPYQKGNVQILTVHMNCRKQWVDHKIQYGRYPDQEDIEYFKEQMKNQHNPEPRLPEVELVEDEDDDFYNGVPF